MIKHTIQGIAIAAVTLFISIQGASAAGAPPYQQSLLNELVGFGRTAYGGTGGAEVWVTNANDSGTGSLREAVTGDAPRWIRFNPGFGHYNIYLASRIDVGSWKTIDARGAVDVKIFNHGFDIRGQSVMVENVIFQQGADDGLKVLDGGRKVWVDHCSFSNWSDEALSIITPVTGIFTDVTVSWCKFSSQSKAMLIGHAPGDPNGPNMRVTLHHNYFSAVDGRQPRIRRALVHAYNNYLVNWGDYGMASVDYGQLRTENNIFEAESGGSTDAVIVYISPEPYGYTNIGYDWKINGATSVENQPSLVFWPPNYYTYSLDAANSTLRTTIIANAGATR